MAARIKLLLATLALATCPPAVAQTAQPFAWEDVDFAPDCALDAAFERLLRLLDGPPADDVVSEFDEPLYNAVSAAAPHVLHLRHEAALHGLRSVEIRHVQGIESGPNNYSLVFADSPERVREVWNAPGWNLPPAGEVRVIDDALILTAVGIGADGALASVTCFSD